MKMSAGKRLSRPYNWDATHQCELAMSQPLCFQEVFFPTSPLTPHGVQLRFWVFSKQVKAFQRRPQNSALQHKGRKHSHPLQKRFFSKSHTSRTKHKINLKNKKLFSVSTMQKHHHSRCRTVWNGIKQIRILWMALLGSKISTGTFFFLLRLGSSF